MGNKPVRYRDVKAEVYEAWYHSNFTMDEITMWYDDFKRNHPSGTVDLDEFKKIYQELCEEGNPDEFAEYVFRLYDTDNSGYLNFREFICGLSMTSWTNPKSRIEWIFKLYDLDRDGHITLSEMKSVLGSIFKMTANPMKGLCLKLPIQTHEFNADTISEQIFAKYDTDKDGKLSKAELIKSTEDDPFLAHFLS